MKLSWAVKLKLTIYGNAMRALQGLYHIEPNEWRLKGTITLTARQISCYVIDERCIAKILQSPFLYMKSKIEM